MREEDIEEIGIEMKREEGRGIKRKREQHCEREKKREEEGGRRWKILGESR